MPTRILSAAPSGLDAVIISVEADSGGGDFGQITIVGLPDAAVSESRERVKSALRHCGLPFPRRRITVNLAPAELKKHGPVYDLPITIAILALQNNFLINFTECLLIGELSLDGRVKPSPSILAMAMAARDNNLKALFVPTENATEARLIEGLTIYPVSNLRELINHLTKKRLISPAKEEKSGLPSAGLFPDLSEIRDQNQAKRALEIAAAGGHNLLLSGPPGSGKTYLAKTLPGILPALSLTERLEVTKIHGIVRKQPEVRPLIMDRPFRSPHHSISATALIGGGAWPRPGEISLAHRGVLFLDEFPEFSRPVLENLRQPLEEGYINIDRGFGRLRFPADFILLAAMNPCPCGYYGQPGKNCRCTPRQIINYRRHLSGPIIDRIDLHISLPRVRIEKLESTEIGENSTTVRRRVTEARTRQSIRLKNNCFLANAGLTNQMVKDFCRIDQAGRRLLTAAAERLNLSARSYFRVLKLARTIADLATEKDILAGHLAEALQYRPKLE
ncbi:MAG: YifB family Mg chelatase-like AAA ATPase [Patescibacteria group bacterium]